MKKTKNLAPKSVTFGDTTTHYFEKYINNDNISKEEKMEMIYGKDPNKIDVSEEDEIDKNKFSQLLDSDKSLKTKQANDYHQRVSDFEQYELNEHNESSDGFNYEIRPSETHSDTQEYKLKCHQLEAKIESLQEEKSFLESELNKSNTENSKLKELESENSLLRLESDAAEDVHTDLHTDISNANKHIIKLNTINKSVKRKVDEIYDLLNPDKIDIENITELISQLKQYVDSSQDVYDNYKTEKPDRPSLVDSFDQEFDTALLDDDNELNRSQEIKKSNNNKQFLNHFESRHYNARDTILDNLNKLIHHIEETKVEVLDFWNIINKS